MCTNRKGRELQGLSVIDLTTGKSLGEVKDIIYTPDDNKVVGFLLSDNSWFWGAKILLYDQVTSIGPDVIMVEEEGKIHNTRYHPDYKRLYQDRIDIRGSELISVSGQMVGTIKDLLIDPKGNIIGYELSDGVVQDLLVGRKTIPVPDQVTLSNGVVIFQSADGLMDEY